MEFLAQQVDYDILAQPKRNIRIKVELLNSSFQTIESVEGNVIDDSYNIDAEADVRRTYNVTFVLDDDSFQIGADKKIWFNKYLRVHTGIQHLRTGIYHWYSIGIFVMDNTSYRYSADTHTLSLSCHDMVAKLNGTRNGNVSGLRLSIPAGTNMREAVIGTLEQLGNIYDYRVENMTVKILTDNGFEVVSTTPYDLDFSGGTNVWNILTSIRDLQVGWECFFKGSTFIMQPIPSYENDFLAIDKETLRQCVIDEDNSLSLSSVFNVIEVWGKTHRVDHFTANTEEEPDNVTLSGNTFNLRLKGTQMLEENKVIGFTSNAYNPENARIQLWRFNEQDEQWETMDFDYPIIYYDNQNILEKQIKPNKVYSLEFKNNGFFYLGEATIVGIAKLVSADPHFLPSPVSGMSLFEYDYQNEVTTNIRYIVNPFSPYCSDFEDIGVIRKTLQNGDYSLIYNEQLALDRAGYENWRLSDLKNSIRIHALEIPWLDVNDKVEYYSNSLKYTDTYLVHRKSGSSSSGLMDVDLVKFDSLYPWGSIVGNIYYPEGKFGYINIIGENPIRIGDNVTYRAEVFSNDGRRINGLNLHWEIIAPDGITMFSWGSHDQTADVWVSFDEKLYGATFILNCVFVNNDKINGSLTINVKHGISHIVISGNRTVLSNSQNQYNATVYDTGGNIVNDVPLKWSIEHLF